jgi:hypothetical protein
MRPAFPASDYYADSAPTRTFGRRWTYPGTDLAWPTPGTDPGWFPRSLIADRGRRHPATTPGASPRLRRRPSPRPPYRPPHTGPGVPPTSSHPLEIGLRAPIPAHIHQIGAGARIKGLTLVSRVYLSLSLAGPDTSGSAAPSRRCQGCSHPNPAPPGSGCPQLQRPAATGHRRSHFTSVRNNQRLVAHVVGL